MDDDRIARVPRRCDSLIFIREIAIAFCGKDEYELIRWFF